LYSNENNNVYLLTPDADSPYNFGNFGGYGMGISFSGSLDFENNEVNFIV